MAILMEETQNYYKIEFEECKVMGLSVYVTYSVYKTTQDRENEKIRRSLLSAFITKVQQRITELNDGLLAAVSELGVEPSDIVDENGMIIAESYPELRAQQNELISLLNIPQQVYDNSYRYGDGIPAALEYTVSKEVLAEEYGFDENWVTDPIMLSAKAEVYCGEYEGEAISQEMYYTRLKTRLVGEHADC